MRVVVVVLIVVVADVVVEREPKDPLILRRMAHVVVRRIFCRLNYLAARVGQFYHILRLILALILPWRLFLPPVRLYPQFVHKVLQWSEGRMRPLRLNTVVLLQFHLIQLEQSFT